MNVRLMKNTLTHKSENNKNVDASDSWGGKHEHRSHFWCLFWKLYLKSRQKVHRNSFGMFSMQLNMMPTMIATTHIATNCCYFRSKFKTITFSGSFSHFITKYAPIFSCDVFAVSKTDFIANVQQMRLFQQKQKTQWVYSSSRREKKKQQTIILKLTFFFDLELRLINCAGDGVSVRRLQCGLSGVLVSGRKFSVFRKCGRFYENAINQCEIRIVDANATQFSIIILLIR